MTKYNLNQLKDSSGLSLYNLAKNLIPGGTQLLSKRPEMFAPDVWPSYYSKAKGFQIWDLEGREFFDMSIMAVGACIIGYADDEIDEIVIDKIKSGVNSSLNCPEEVELANILIELHPWFQMVRYARSGGEAMSIAVRIARAHTKKDIVLFSGYHGWTDWYLAANLNDGNHLDGQLMPGLEPNGVPKGLSGSAIPFDANSIDSLKNKIQGIEKNIAAIIIEPARGEEASKDYLKDLKNFANEIEAVLIFDEITSGFRMCPGGIHRKYEVYPDIAVFAKSMANGYAMAAILGNEKVMQAAQKTFISSTNWTDRVGPTAALATIKKYIREKVENHLIHIGTLVKEIWKIEAKKNNINLNISGLPSLVSFSFKEKNSEELNTFFTVEMLKHGFLGFRQFKPSFAHHKEILPDYQKAVGKIFDEINNGNYLKILDTPIHHSGFKRLTKE